MIGRLVRAIRPGEDPQPPGNEAPGTRPAGATGDADDADGRGGLSDPPTGDGADGLAESAFLDPDERILFLLSECDGRMWQQQVVERTGYSPARVSELLSEMEDDGRVNRYWNDGEKVVSFPELGPE